jgi:hypothetical protein
MTTSICLVPPASKKTTILPSLFNYKKRKRTVNASPNSSAAASKNCPSNTFLDRTKVGHPRYHRAEAVAPLEEVAVQVQPLAPVLA